MTNQFQVRTVIPHCRQSKKKSKNVVSDDQTDDEENNGEENDDDDESEQGNGSKYFKPKSKVQQPLTCIQSSDTRICIKVRSVVEWFSHLKKKNKAIDRVMNTVLGHLGFYKPTL